MLFRFANQLEFSPAASESGLDFGDGTAIDIEVRLVVRSIVSGNRLPLRPKGATVLGISGHSPPKSRSR